MSECEKRYKRDDLGQQHPSSKRRSFRRWVLLSHLLRTFHDRRFVLQRFNEQYVPSSPRIMMHVHGAVIDCEGGGGRAGA